MTAAAADRSRHEPMRSARSLGRFGGPLVVAALFLVLALHGIGAAPVVGDDEAREAGIVVDIVQGGHRLLPRFNRELIPDKPLLYHWLAALACHGSGGWSEAAVRLPAALAAAATVAATGLFTAAAAGPLAGLWAATALATTPSWFNWARVARPDTLLVLCLTLALASAFGLWSAWTNAAPGGAPGRGETSPASQRHAVIAAAFLGLGVLAKGPVAPALAAVVLLGAALWNGSDARAAAAVRLCRPVPAVVFLALALPWYAIALAGWGREFLSQHLLGRYVGNLLGGLGRGGTYSTRPLWFHLSFYPLHLLAITLPWLPFSLLGLLRWRDRRLGRLLALWLIAPVIVFTPAQYKLRHYLLPALPAAAALAGLAMASLAEGRPRRPQGWGSRRLAAAGALPLGAAAAGFWLVATHRGLFAHADRELLEALANLPPPILVAAAAVAAAGLAAAAAVRSWEAAGGALAATLVFWMATVAPAFERATAARASLRPLAQAVAATVPSRAPLAFYGHVVPSVVLYAGRPIPSLHRRRAALAPGNYLIVTEQERAQLARAGLVGRRLLATTGRIGNLRRGRLYLVRLEGQAARLALGRRRQPGGPAAPEAH